MTEQAVREAFAGQGAACRSLGSPFTGWLCELCAEKLQDDGVVANKLLRWEGDVSGSGYSVPLRLMGALHALVRSGRAPELTAVYPPGHEGLSDQILWDVIHAAFNLHADFILERLLGPPQTNEVRRSAATLPLFLEVSRLTGLPLVLSEVGASAGLNLFLDKFHIKLGDQAWGDPSSSVTIDPKWHGNPAPDAPLEITSRAGCDLAPINPGSVEDRERLLSYIWADQPDRFARTVSALDIAAKSNIRVETRDALDWLKERTATKYDGAAHVIYSTIAWQYLPEAARAKGEDIIRTAGAKATEAAPLAWVSKETDDASPGAGLSITLWPGGERREVGRADFHGRWVDWTGWSQ
ncbi:MAG: hypothetical protein COB93_09585 [Sneathiella sp.]|nr:MAG: hypothetical protein COB93_09585 [Sneathiella sp.]